MLRGFRCASGSVPARLRNWLPSGRQRSLLRVLARALRKVYLCKAARSAWRWRGVRPAKVFLGLMRQLERSLPAFTGP